MFLLYAALGYGALAAVSILDKFIVSNEKISPVAFTFYSTIFVAPLFLAVPFGVRLPANWFDATLFVVSGLSFAGGLYASYKGFAVSEVSHLGPFIGATIPFFVLILSTFFLGEVVQMRALVAVVLLATGSLIIASERSLSRRDWHWGMLWGLVSGWLFAVSHITAKYSYLRYGFWSGFVWTKATLGLAGIALLFHPDVRRALTNIKRAKKSVPLFSAKTFVVALDKVLGVVGVVLIQYAIALGSVTVVNALAGLQYALLIISVWLLSTLKPGWFKEQYARGEFSQELAAVAFIAIGLGLLIT